MLYDFYFHLFAAPSISPSNLTAQNSSESPSLFLTWSEIPILERNGEVIGYNLRWMKLCDFLASQNGTSNLTDCRRVISKNVSDFQLKFVRSPLLDDIVGNLSYFTHYIFRIAACTITGAGPEMEITVITDEGGTYVLNIFWSIYFRHKGLVL